MSNLQRYISIYPLRLCPFCGHSAHAKACGALRALLMADPPDGPPIVIVEAPDETPPEGY